MPNNKLICGFHALSAAIKRYPQCVQTVYYRQSREDKRLDALLAALDEAEIPHIASSQQTLAALAGPVVHQGVIGVLSSVIDYSEGDLDQLLSLSTLPAFILILDAVQDPHNLGACMRSAYGLGVDFVVIPKNRAVGLTPVVRKVACGAAEALPLVRVTNLVRTIKLLQSYGIWVVGMAGDSEMRVSQVDLTGPIALVMGNEGQGIRKNTQTHCDFVAKIPMSARAEDFNVSVATGITLYEAARQRKFIFE